MCSVWYLGTQGGEGGLVLCGLTHVKHGHAGAAARQHMPWPAVPGHAGRQCPYRPVDAVSKCNTSRRYRCCPNGPHAHSDAHWQMYVQRAVPGHVGWRCPCWPGRGRPGLCRPVDSVTSCALTNVCAACGTWARRAAISVAWARRAALSLAAALSACESGHMAHVQLCAA